MVAPVAIDFFFIGGYRFAGWSFSTGQAVKGRPLYQDFIFFNIVSFIQVRVVFVDLWIIK